MTERWRAFFSIMGTTCHNYKLYFICRRSCWLTWHKKASPSRSRLSASHAPPDNDDEVVWGFWGALNDSSGTTKEAAGAARGEVELEKERAIGDTVKKYQEKIVRGMHMRQMRVMMAGGFW